MAAKRLRMITQNDFCIGTTTMRNNNLMAILLAATAVAAAQPTSADAAQAFPTRPVRLVSAGVVGSGSDVVARVLSAKLTDVLGQQVVVDNRSGGSGLIGAELVARAAPDGHTLWLATMTQLISTTLYQRLMLTKEFAPVGMVASTPFVIVASPSLPVKSTAELIAFAKAKPNYVMYGSSGTGTTAHLCMVLFETVAGIQLVHVPYKGAAVAMTDLMGGQMHTTCAAAPTMSLYAQSGKVRPLGVTTLGPSKLAPSIPPIADALPGFELIGWYGVLAPLNMPKEIIHKLNEEFTRIVGMPEMRERLIAVGAEPAPTTPAAFGTFLQKETERWTKLLKEAGIKAAN
jgi:tripartite-type tricarboxylate transporter receptor subunit TctC